MDQIEYQTWEQQQEYWIQMRENAKLENLILSARLRKIREEE